MSRPELGGGIGAAVEPCEYCCGGPDEGDEGERGHPHRSCPGGIGGGLAAECDFEGVRGGGGLELVGRGFTPAGGSERVAGGAGWGRLTRNRVGRGCWRCLLESRERRRAARVIRRCRQARSWWARPFWLALWSGATSERTDAGDCAGPGWVDLTLDPGLLESLQQCCAPEAELVVRLR